MYLYLIDKLPMGPKILPLFSGNVTTDNMLKDLDVALRASRNYIGK